MFIIQLEIFMQVILVDNYACKTCDQNGRNWITKTIKANNYDSKY